MNLIVAVDIHNAIGKDDKLLDHFSKDLKHFKELTINKVVVMGKNTYYSLPKHSLPNRVNIVVSSTMQPDGNCLVCRDFKELFSLLDTLDFKDEDVFIIGGASIYSQLYSYCNTFYITRIFREYKEANKFFNEVDEIKKDCKLIDIQTVREKSNNSEIETVMDFIIYKREV